MCVVCCSLFVVGLSFAFFVCCRLSFPLFVVRWSLSVALCPLFVVCFFCVDGYFGVCSRLCVLFVGCALMRVVGVLFNACLSCRGLLFVFDVFVV